MFPDVIRSPWPFASSTLEGRSMGRGLPALAACAQAIRGRLRKTTRLASAELLQQR